MPPSRIDLVALTEDPLPFLASDDAVLRRMAVTAIDGRSAIDNVGRLCELSTDPDPTIRGAVAEKLGVCGDAGLEALASLQADDIASVREAAATAYGEIGSSLACEWLAAAASHDPDRGVREAAVAALGAIGDPGWIDTLLELLHDAPPPVRRRAVAALTVFDDDRIESAIRLAALDKNPGVREAAEMVVGRQIREAGSTSPGS